VKKRLFLYRCEPCKLDFGVAEEFDDHSVIVCPSCKFDGNLLDYQQVVSYRILNNAGLDNIYRLIEESFGRLLSPLEIQMIGEWMDEGIDQALIKMALREAISRNVKNLKYIERILTNWKDQGVETVEQAREISKKYKSYKQPVAAVLGETTTRPEPPIYNWLES
jgi:DnaD/phage-associated family protein